MWTVVSVLTEETDWGWPQLELIEYKPGICSDQSGGREERAKKMRIKMLQRILIQPNYSIRRYRIIKIFMIYLYLNIKLALVCSKFLEHIHREISALKNEIINLYVPCNFISSLKWMAQKYLWKKFKSSILSFKVSLETSKGQLLWAHIISPLTPQMFK